MNQNPILEIVLAEAARRAGLSKPFDSSLLLDKDFKFQNDFIQDKARLKALFCTRRAAKSYTAGLYLIKEAIENPGVNCLFIGLTRLSAEGIVWKDILKVIDRKHGLNIQFNQSKLTATLPNGSVIWLAGVDTDEDEMNKLLGKKYRLVCLDEASLYTINLQLLVYGILKPATVDNNGTICMMGTSSNITRGLFFDITTCKEPGWSLHTWTAKDNPHIAKQWAEELEDIRINRPNFMETPLFRQWYLNEWVVDTDKLVYKFSETKNTYLNLPLYHDDAWSYVLGVDLGYHPDPSAFVLVGFHKNDKVLYILETFKKTEMDITDVANKIKEYQKRYSIYKVIIDGSNKQAVEEMQKRHDIALTAAEKTGKSDFIELMNAELIQAHIKLSPLCEDLKEEYKTLVWELDGDRIALPRKEHPNLPNHLCDAALYAWRFCYQWLAEPIKPKIDLKNQWIELSRKMAEENLQKQIDADKARQDSEYALAQIDFDDPTQYLLNRRRNG